MRLNEGRCFACDATWSRIQGLFKQISALQAVVVTSNEVVQRDKEEWLEMIRERQYLVDHIRKNCDSYIDEDHCLQCMNCPIGDMLRRRMDKGGVE